MHMAALAMLTETGGYVYVFLQLLSLLCVHSCHYALFVHSVQLSLLAVL